MLLPSGGRLKWRFRWSYGLSSAFDRKALRRFMRRWTVFEKAMGYRLRSYVLCKVSKICRFEKDDFTVTLVHSVSPDIHN
jgi:hypothetical protein